MIPIDDLESISIDNAEDLMVLSNEAIAFIRSQKWCKRIIDVKLDRGWGYIIAVFFFSIEPYGANIPNNLWVIVGDLPPAYIDVEDNPNGACAIDAYVSEMEGWINNVVQGKSIEGLIPVNAPPTEDTAMMLRERLDIIKQEILINLKEEIAECQG